MGLNDFLLVIQTLAVPVTGVTIAYQQCRVAKLKRAQEFYERRYPIYKATLDFVSAVFKSCSPSAELLERFSSETAEARFLFGSAVNSYLMEMYGKALDIKIANETVSRGAFLNELERDLLKRRQNAIFWFRSQLDDAATMFEADLSILRSNGSLLNSAVRKISNTKLAAIVQKRATRLWQRTA